MRKFICSKTIMLAFSIGAICSLSSCNIGSNASSHASSASSNADSANSSADTTASTSSSAETTGLELTLAHTSVDAGTDFFDGCQPAVIWHQSGTTKDMTNYWNFIKYNIKDSGGTVYPMDEALPSGQYTATATYVSKSRSSHQISFTVNEKAPIEASEGNGYTLCSPDDSYRIGNFDGVGALGAGKLPSVGNQKLLVIPVTFQDAADFSDADLTILNDAYFGEADSTGWQSLASYYHTSSYGKLTLTGTITPEYVYPDTAANFENSGSTNDLANKAVAFAKSEGYKMTDYDSNKDGYIDGLELVYKTDRPNKSEGGKDIWWNFTSDTTNEPDTDDPAPYKYFWSLFNYIQNGYYKTNIDCHTLIHESGHMMGLNDYYSYNNDEDPAGGVDMMDMNIGDHDAYSKFMYGWVTPKVIDGSASNFNLTLNSFTDTGDCAIVRNTTTNKFNGTPYDEYLMLQYYTPTGLNEQDSTGYPEWSSVKSSSGTAVYGHGGTYAKPGLQIFHIDNRLVEQYGTYDTTTGKILTKKYRYTRTPKSTVVSNDDGTYVSPALQVSNNSLKYTAYVDENGDLAQGGQIRELTCLPANGSTVFLNSTFYNSLGVQNILFGTSDYGEDCTTYSNAMMRDLFPNGVTFNDGSTNNWTFSVTKQTDSTITLHFVENAPVNSVA